MRRKLRLKLKPKPAATSPPIPIATTVTPLSAGLLTVSDGFKNFNLPQAATPGPAQSHSKARMRLAKHLSESEVSKLKSDTGDERVAQRCLLILGQVIKQFHKVNQGKNVPFFRRMLGHKCGEVILGILSSEDKSSSSKQAVVGGFEAYAIAVFEREEDARSALKVPEVDSSNLVLISY